ncbi:MAG: hypothetical protein ACQEQV_00550 [Fibrobacterota bacterium]
MRTLIKAIGSFPAVILVCSVFLRGPLSAGVWDFRHIDMNGTDVHRRGNFSISSRVSPPGNSVPGAGVIFDFNVGVTDRLTLGVGYGGDGLIGRDSVSWYPWPGARLKYRLLNRPSGWSVTTGVDMQGFGGRASGYRGYVYKSQGFFLAFHKGYLFFSSFPAGLTLDVNYALEDLENVHWPNFAMATDIRINSELSAELEYDFATNQLDKDADRADSYWHPGRGFFNAGLKWRVVPSLQFAVNFRDIFSQRIRSRSEDSEDPVYGWGREIKLTYFSGF